MAKPIKYVSSDKDSTTGQLFVQWNENGKIRRKSWSWHPCGRSHDEAYKLAEKFLLDNGHCRKKRLEI